MSEASLHKNVSMESLVARVADEFLKRQKNGEWPDIEEYAARYPEAADLLRKVLASLELIGRSEFGGPGLPGTTDEPAGTLGDFRILREVGKGGMGVVYEAEQVSLRRRVALKVLPFAATLDARHLQRFHNEAQAAACLHHTNIVPVFYVGCERSVHFYAMQFIEGQSLSELIRQLRGLEKKDSRAAVQQPRASYQVPPEGAIVAGPTVGVGSVSTPLTGDGRRGRDYYRKVAELGVQAAEALDHAHQLGIVHRDIKPANLLLDGRGNVWVTDFGLAHMQHGAVSLTLSGQAVGTPRYMSPEQALAKRVPIDHRTDVYSLGVTLYELLTLQPAFACEDRQELLRQIALEEPTRPRRWERAIPAELEIIVLKAMEKRAQDRYATAQELADDLRRWLLDRPIRARRPALAARLGRWCRRHKPLVTGVLAALVMGLAVLAGSIGWVVRDQAVRRAEIQKVVLAALEDTDAWQQQNRLPEALSAARRAEGLLAGADVDEALRQRVRTRRADLELLDRLENIRLEKMTAVKDGHFDHDAADGLYEQTFRDAGLDVESLSVEEAAERICGSTVATELAAVLDHWCSIRSLYRGVDDPIRKTLFRIARLADPDPWRTRVREALERKDYQALREMAASPEAFLLAPASLISLGNALGTDEKARDQAEVFLREAKRRHPNDFWLNYQLWVYYLKVMQPPRLEEAIRFAEAAMVLRPDSPGTHLNLGIALWDKGLLDEAVAEFQMALSLKTDYAEAHNNLGVALHRKGRTVEAIAEFYEAIRLKEDYLDPHLNLGDILRVQGRLDEALAESRKAVRLKEDSPEAHTNLGCVLLDRGQSGEAIAEFYEAIRLKKDYAKAHYNLGLVLARMGRQDEAIDEYREAIRLKKDYGQAHTNLGRALSEKGHLDEAIDEYRAAIRVRENFPEAYIAHNNLGNALLKKRQLDEAIAEYREAIRLNKDFAEAHSNLGAVLEQKGQFTEALVYRRRGHELGSKNPRWRYPSAQWVRDCERLVELDSKLPAIMSGEIQPADPAECLGLAKLCVMPCKKRYVASVRFFRQAFEEVPKLADDLNAQPRYNAACAAALAGCGQGKDADKLDAQERARLRQQALDWLRADLRAYGQQMEKSQGKAGAAIAARMQHWLQDTDFAGVRSADALARLPETERPKWQKLWEEVEALRQSAAERPKTTGSARP